VTGSLFVNLGGGEDQIIFDTSAGAAPSFYDVALNMGTDASVDRVIMWSLNTTGSLNVDTGGGNDWVFLGGPVIGDGFGWDSFTVNSGAGADNVTVKNGTQIKGWVDIQTYSALSETDSDLVHFDTEVFVQRGVDVRMGGGDDEFTVTRPDLEQVYYGGLHANGAITVNLGDGADTAYLRGVRTNSNLNVFSGAGADDVTIDSRTIYNPFFDTYYIASVGGNMEVQTYDSLEETDADEVRLYDGRISGSLLARLGGGDDFFQLTYADYIHNDLNVEMGAGNDTAEISAFVLDHLMAWMGEGNDVLHLGKTWAYRLIADGGLGGDSLTTASDTQSTYRDLFGWEYINAFPTWWDDIVYDDEGGGVLSP
jgi:hypothetical protein